MTSPSAGRGPISRTLGAVSSPERSVSSAPEPTSSAADPDLSLFGRPSERSLDAEPPNGSGNGASPSRPRAVRVLVDSPAGSSPPEARYDEGTDPHTTELEFDDPVLSELDGSTPVVPIVPADDANLHDSYEESYEQREGSPAGLFTDDDTGYLTLADQPDDEGDDLGEDDEDDELVEVVGKKDTRGKLKARKVRRVVRYVSPWSVLKVSLLFYACLWIIGTIAAVLLWRVAVETGAIGNVEKFVARLFGEKSFTIDGREILRASTIAGVILVFAGTGFTVLMSLLFNVICDITGGIRFTVLELESTKRRLRRRAQAARDARQS